MRYLMTTIVIFYLLSMSSCNNKTDHKSKGEEKTSNQTTPTTTQQVDSIGHEFILVYDSATISKILTIKISGNTSNPAVLDSFYTRLARQLYLYRLKQIDPRIEIYGATAVSLFARIPQQITLTGLRAKMLALDSIQNVYQNFTIKINLPKPDSVLSAAPTAEAQWGIVRISNSSKPNGDYKAAWILDSGVDPSHSDLNVDMVYSRSFVSGQTLNDVMGHGTHVAGIIGAKANGTGVLGVAPNAPIRALKVISNDDHMTADDLNRALNYVLVNAQPDQVMNLSFVRGFGQGSEEQLIQQIASRGVFVAIAAGNSNNMPSGRAENVDTYTVNGKMGVYPARINGNKIFTVMAFVENSTDFNAGNYGSSVDYIMPGVNIVSTYPGNKYVSMSGTSMASPHMAGLLLITRGGFTTSGNIVCTHDGAAYKIAHE